MALYQGQVSPALGYRKPSTIRAAVFLAGAILGRAGHKRLLRFSQAWGGILKHKALIDAALHKPCPSRRFWLPASSGLLLPLRFAILAMQRAATLQLNRVFGLKTKRELTVAPK
jgi:hypothetical protein